MKSSNSTQTHDWKYGTIEFQNDDDAFNIHIKSDIARKSNVQLDLVRNEDREDASRLWDLETVKAALQSDPQSEDFYRGYADFFMGFADNLNKRKNPWSLFTIRDDEDDFLGQIGLTKKNSASGKASLGYAVTLGKRNRGYAKTSAGMLLPYAALLVEKGYGWNTETEMEWVVGNTAIGNLGSQRVMSGIGMHRDPPAYSDADVIKYSYKIPSFEKACELQASVVQRW